MSACFCLRRILAPSLGLWRLVQAIKAGEHVEAKKQGSVMHCWDKKSRVQQAKQTVTRHH